MDNVYILSIYIYFNLGRNENGGNDGVFNPPPKLLEQKPFLKMLPAT